MVVDQIKIFILPMQETSDEPMVKLFVELEPADWHNNSTESLWAMPLGGDLYRVRNIPFYAMGLSHDDVVRASLRNDELFVEQVERHAGHSTYRLFTMEGITDEQWQPFWQHLEEIGCTYERATQRLFAVDVPPDTDIHKAYELLDSGEKAGVWGFQEAHCEHPLKR